MSLPNRGKQTDSTPLVAGGRLPQLDLLRGIAILLVLGRHAVIGRDESGALKPLATVWYEIGWSGVDLFFVLSGFLIGGLIFAELKKRGAFNAKRFLVRRAFKILPLAYLFMVIAAFMDIVRGDAITFASTRHGIRNILVGVLNLQNYLGTGWTHTWSLAVEEHFYLGLPALLVGLTAWGRKKGTGLEPLRSIPLIAGCLVIFCTGCRYVALHNMTTFEFWKAVPLTHYRIDGLFFGVMLAYLCHFSLSFQGWAARNRLALLLLALVLMSPLWFLNLESRLVPIVGFMFLYVAYGMILLAFVTTKIGPECGLVGRLMTCAPARWITSLGVYSYPVYLFHIDLVRTPLLRIFPSKVSTTAHPGLRWLLGMGVFIVLSYAAGVFFNRVLERRMLVLRDRLFPMI